jgi:hypothetical protein
MSVNTDLLETANILRYLVQSFIEALKIDPGNASIEIAGEDGSEALPMDEVLAACDEAIQNAEAAQ